jgi:uncharacterized metal-binding protein
MVPAIAVLILATLLIMAVVRIFSLQNTVSSLTLTNDSYSKAIKKFLGLAAGCNRCSTIIAKQVQKKRKENLKKGYTTPKSPIERKNSKIKNNFGKS